MRRRIWFSLACVALAALVLWWGVQPTANTQAEVQSDTVALLLDTDIGTGALQMKLGAKLAAKERQLDLITAAPDYAGGTVLSQAALMEQLLEKNVKAILLVPVSGEDLSKPLALAAQRKVPVLSLGDGANPGNIACVISGDSEQAGEMAAATLLERLPAEAHILLITGTAEDTAAALCLKGAQRALGTEGSPSVLRTVALDGQTPDDVLTLLALYPHADGILCLTGEATEIAAKAMSRTTREIVLVGMDCGQNRTTYLENRQVDAMVLGMPFAMGYLGVQFASQAIAGKEIPARYGTESRVIDLDNMYLPENQKLVFPMLQ